MVRYAVVFVAGALLGFLVTARLGAKPAAIPVVTPFLPGTPVAKFHGVTLSREEVESRLRGLSQRELDRYKTPQGRRQFVEQLLQTELLAREAAREGFDRDPGMVAAAKRALADRYLERKLDEAKLREELTEAEVAEYFRDHPANFSRPPRGRFLVIALLVPEGEAPRRAAKRKLAAEIRREIVEAEKKDPQAFQKLATLRSEEPNSRALGGDTGLVTQEELAARFGAALGGEAFEKVALGEISAPLETPEGVFLVKVLAKDPGLSLTLDGNREQVRAEAARSKRMRLYSELLTRLKTEAKAEVFAEALAPPDAGHP